MLVSAGLRRLGAMAVVVAGLIWLPHWGVQPVEAATECPPLVSSATRLLIVTAPGFDNPRARAVLFARSSIQGEWRRSEAPFPVMLGRNGLGWAWDQARAFGRGPVKREGDGKTPAGIFRAGIPFGLHGRALGNYLTIRTGTVCVDDVRSPHYNRITTSDRIGPGNSHEKMWRIPLYDLGLVVEHATNARARGGSCIFLHVWRSPGRATAGCVAMERAQMSRVQELFDRERSAIAILPERAGARLRADCRLVE